MERTISSGTTRFIPHLPVFPAFPGTFAAEPARRQPIMPEILWGDPKGPQVDGREQLEHGMRVMFKVDGMARRCKGIITGSDVAGWKVSGARRADGGTALLQNLSREHIWTLAEHHSEKTPSATREPTTRGGSTIAAAESRRRAEVGQQRSQLDEAKVLTHPVFVSRMRSTLSHLASSNGFNPHYEEIGGALHNDDLDANELYSEYITASMNSYRTETSKASEKDLHDLHEVLDGERAESRILMSMARAGKTAAIRYITFHQRYLQEHIAYDGTMEDDQESGMRAIAGECGCPPEYESNAAKKALLGPGIDAQLQALDDSVAAAIIRMKFGLDRFTHGYKELDIAAALNRANMPAPNAKRWDADQVKARMTKALASLARTRSVRDLRMLLQTRRLPQHCTASSSYH